jgi:hypothetical protein
VNGRGGIEVGLIAVRFTFGYLAEKACKLKVGRILLSEWEEGIEVGLIAVRFTFEVGFEYTHTVHCEVGL